MLRFSSDQKTSQIVNILVKFEFPTAETPVRVQKEETRLNGIWMLGDCLVERQSLEIIIKHESCSSPYLGPQGTYVVYSYTENCLPACVKEDTKGLFSFWWYVGCVRGNDQ